MQKSKNPARTSFSFVVDPEGNKTGFILPFTSLEKDGDLEDLFDGLLAQYRLLTGTFDLVEDV